MLNENLLTAELQQSTKKDRKTSKQTDPSKAGFTGIGNSIEDIMRQNAEMKKAAAKKAKKEELEFARHKASVISRGVRSSTLLSSLKAVASFILVFFVYRPPVTPILVILCPTTHLFNLLAVM